MCVICRGALTTKQKPAGTSAFHAASWSVDSLYHTVVNVTDSVDGMR